MFRLKLISGLPQYCRFQAKQNVGRPKPKENIMSSNIDRAQGIYSNFAAGNIDAVLGAMAPDDITWVEPEAPGYPFGGTHIGSQAVLAEVFGAVPANYSEFSVRPIKFVEVSETEVYVRVEFSGTGLHTGRTFATSGVDILTFGADGKLDHFQSFINPYAFISVLNP
jgi:uncharacterized protein